MRKTNNLKTWQIIVLIISLLIINNVSAQAMCDECKQNPAGCKLQASTTVHPHECKHLQNVPPDDERIIEKKVMIKEPDRTRGFLGVVTNDEDGKLIIEKVLPESPAEKAGLVQEMVIVSINGTKVKTRDELIKILQTTKPNDEVTLVVKANKQETTVKVILGETPKVKKPMGMMPMREELMEMECEHCEKKTMLITPSGKPPKDCAEMKCHPKSMRKCCLFGPMPMRSKMCGEKKHGRKCKTYGRGAGYFAGGLTMLPYHELNTYLSAHNLDTIDNQQFVFGGGGWGQGKRVRFGGFGMGGGKVVTNDTVSVEIGYGFGIFEIGYAVVNTKHFILTPQIGLGGYGVGLTIKLKNPRTDLHDLFFLPTGKAEVSKGGLTLLPSLVIDIPISKIGLHLKGGYLYTPLSSGWQQNDFGTISGPDLKLNGTFVTMGILFGGGK